MPSLTAAQIDAAIARVSEVFDAKWAAREDSHLLSLARSAV
jgi:hypothetical protein